MATKREVCAKCGKAIINAKFYWLMGGVMGLTFQKASKLHLEAYLSVGFHDSPGNSSTKNMRRKELIEFKGDQFEVKFCTKKCLKKFMDF